MILTEGAYQFIKIESFAEVTTGGTPSTNVEDYWKDGNIPWLNSGDLNQDIITYSSNFITENGLRNSSARMMPKNTVLIALTGATTGQVGLLTFDACANQSVTGILPSKRHNSKFLYYYLKTLRNRIFDISWGGAQPHINQQFVKDLQVPLPDVAEQTRIADILDRADNIRRKRQEAIKLTDELLRSVFLDTFGDPVSNSKDWDVGTIADLVTEVKYGTSSASNPDGQYPYLRMNNITYSGELDISDLKYIDIADKDKEKYLTKKGDLLFNRTNSKELVGKTTVYCLNKPMAIAGYLIRVRTNDKAIPEYISGYLNSNHGKTTLQHMCKSIVGMANINARELQNIKILIPPIELQKKYKIIYDQNKAVKDKMLSQSEILETQFQALSQRVFKGEL